jgi:hypothetical protein
LISTEPKPRRALPQSRARLSALGMPDLPEPLVGRHKTFLSAAVLHAPRETRRPLEHELQHLEQYRRDLDVTPVACPVKGDGDLIGQAPRVAWLWLLHLGLPPIAPEILEPKRAHHNGEGASVPEGAGGRGFLIANRYESLTVAIALTVRRWLGTRLG